MNGCKCCGTPCEGEFCSVSCEEMHRNFNVTHREKGESKRTVKRSRSIHTQKDITRQMMSDRNVEDSLPWHFHDGESWHCISYGDVDSLSYLKHVLRGQRLEYALLTTWAMASADINELSEWVDDGLIGRLDVYVSEHFLGTYSKELELLCALCRRTGGRAASIRNHSKIMCLYGDNAICVESSANINANSHIEQTSLVVSEELCDFYKGVFDSLEPLNSDMQSEDWRPWTRGKKRRRSART